MFKVGGFIDAILVERAVLLICEGGVGGKFFRAGGSIMESWYNERLYSVWGRRGSRADGFIMEVGAGMMMYLVW